MKTKTLLLGAVASVALAGSADAAHFKGWYVGLEAGANWIQDADVDNDTIDPFWGGGYPGSQSSFDTGWAGMGTIGYAWEKFRLELELGYRQNDLDEFFFGKGTATGGGKFDEFSQMLNLYYDERINEDWSFALGAGVGGDSIQYRNDSGFHTVPIHDSDYVFAWQLIGSVSYAIGSRTELFASYRYFNAVDAEFTEVDGGGYLHNDTYDDVNKHTVTIGLRFDLSPDEEPAPPPPPPPPAEPPPPPPAHFVIFFGFGKCNITAEADAVLGDAAAAAKSGGSASVSIVGHTDSVGSNAANQKLSECRANAAKSNLVGKGVSEGAISTSGRGETELMVQTGDGVKEPQNRRATVDLQ